MSTIFPTRHRAILVRTLGVAASLVVAAAALVAPQPAAAQAYPTKPVRMVVPFPPGGVARHRGAAHRAETLRSVGPAVVVENKPGAGGNIGADLVAKSPPDGYTILLGALSTHAVNPEPVRDDAVRRGEGLRADHADRR